MKLKKHKISGICANWIEGWLSQRYQRVVLNGSMSDWSSVYSGVPQGSVLGPVLFLIYVNDIDSCISSNLLKFADDTKLYRVIENIDDVKSLQLDLDELVKWAEMWQMSFNTDKCKVMHIGKHNEKAKYMIDGIVMKDIHQEKDLGVIVQSNLKVDAHCAKVVNTANRILGMISRTFTSRSRVIILQLYRSLVRPHLDYCAQAWRPHLKKDILAIEKVQRRATRMIDDIGKLEYEDRLLQLGLTTLETRRIRGDLLEMFKIFKGFDNLDHTKFFKLNSNVLRGHSLKLYKTRFESSIGENSFYARSIDEWNALTPDIVNCTTIDSFKSKLDDHLKYSR